MHINDTWSKEITASIRRNLVCTDCLIVQQIVSVYNHEAVFRLNLMILKAFKFNIVTDVCVGPVLSGKIIKTVFFVAILKLWKCDDKILFGSFVYFMLDFMQQKLTSQLFIIGLSMHFFLMLGKKDEVHTLYITWKISRIIWKPI